MTGRADAKEIRVQYREAFREALVPIQERLANSSASAQGPQGPISGSMPRSFLFGLMRTQKFLSKATPGPAIDEEMTQYLDGSTLIPVFISIFLGDGFSAEKPSPCPSLCLYS